jgi:hypothetical protein
VGPQADTASYYCTTTFLGLDYQPWLGFRREKAGGHFLASATALRLGRTIGLVMFVALCAAAYLLACKAMVATISKYGGTAELACTAWCRFRLPITSLIIFIPV